MERTNALHLELPEKTDFVSSDVGWTRQALILPKAVSLLKPGGSVLSLVKPQYEAEKGELLAGKGRVAPEAVPRILGRIRHLLEEMGLPFQGPLETPFLGDKGKNPEYMIAVGPVT
ncbi:MAG: hypothetical protein V1918_10775 [Planctomycetota bacterium]